MLMDTSAHWLKKAAEGNVVNRSQMRPREEDQEFTSHLLDANVANVSFWY